MKKFYLFILMLSALVANKATAQFNYTAANAVNTTGTYTDLATTGTVINTKFAGGTLTYDDDTSSVQNIGFNFVFNGTSHTQFVLSTNGYIRLGSAPATLSYNAITSPDANLIYPFSYDLDGGTSPEYRVATTGSAGSRVCTIQFKNVRDWNATPAAAQYANINFQIKLFEGSNNVEFVYGTFTATAAAAAFFPANVGVKGNTSSATVNATKSSAAAWTTATFIDGNYTGNSFNSRNNILPVSGVLYRFVAVGLPANDAAVRSVYTYGKLPRGIGHIIRAEVANTGSNTLTNVNVTLNVTGANTYNNVKVIPTLAPSTSTVVVFDEFSATATGVNTVSVSVPADDNNANNLSTVSQTVTTNTFNYAYTTTPTSGVGANGNTIDIAMKFSAPYSNQINELIPRFQAAGNAFSVAIFDASGTGGTPGTAIYTSGLLTTAIGTNSVPVSPAATVSGDFYVIITQTSTTNFQLSYETENPIRDKSFYLAVPSGGAFSDFSPGNNFRPMCDVVFANPLPLNLVSFKASEVNNKSLLTWVTSNEVNFRNFEVERSLNGTDFNSIATVNGLGNAGNNTYSITDDRLQTSGNVFYYRLKMNDKDGMINYSSVVKLLSNKKAGDVNITVINPVRDHFILQVASNVDRKMTVKVVNAEGRVLMAKPYELSSGSQTISLNETGIMPAGVYTLVMEYENEMKAVKVVKQ